MEDRMPDIRYAIQIKGPLEWDDQVMIGSTDDDTLKSLEIVRKMFPKNEYRLISIEIVRKMFPKNEYRLISTNPLSNKEES